MGARLTSGIRFKYITAGFSMLVICYMFMQYYDGYLFENYWKYVTHPPAYPEIPNNKSVPEEKEIRNKSYKILIWDGIPSWLHPKEIFSTCEFPGCSVSDKRTDLNNSDAVFYYGPSHRGQLPSKVISQVWIFMCLETPKNTRLFRHFNGKLNWTWSYRRDSDILRTYGTFTKSQIKLQNTDIPKKNKTIAWFVSNCHSQSKRLKYVELLKKYIDVDVYGACGNLKCSSKKENACRELLKSSYNFYLSLENSFCRDYVTEKALIRIRDYVVPVVRGGSNYSLHLPPHSYIDTSKYITVENLSHDLLALISNQSVYKMFHQWRQFYTVGDTVRSGWCELCKRLHFQDKYKRLYNSFQGWWSGNDETRVCYDAADLR